MPEENADRAAAEIVVEIAGELPPGRALDLACGTGRHALWLAERGWRVAAVDLSAPAIASLHERAARLNLAIDARIADLSTPAYEIEAEHWDLIVMYLYLDWRLLERAKLGLKPGGILIAAVLLMERERKRRPYRANPGELERRFEGWEVLDSLEGTLTSHRAIAEIAARKPNASA